MIKRVKQHMLENRRLLQEVNDKLAILQSSNNELLFAQYFRDSIQDSTWVKNKNFSAYGAAANYSLLYKLFKIYDVLKPQNILEFGLGQTTKLTYQYVTEISNTNAFVIDDDHVWIEAYKKQFEIPTGMQIVKLDLQDFRYGGKILQKNAEYKDLDSVIKDTKFDLIVVDGPIGWDKVYSRPNIISLIDSLASDWIVIFDDAERNGEQRTIGLFKEQLQKKKVQYGEFEVSGNKSQYFFCAPHLLNIARNI